MNHLVLMVHQLWVAVGTRSDGGRPARIDHPSGFAVSFIHVLMINGG